MDQSDFNEDDEIAFLYEDVIHTLKSGGVLNAFDLETLVDVYDYACDLSDEYVIQEIMTNVLGRSPRFLPMLERKAVRYFQMSEPEAADAVAGKLPSNSFIRALIRQFIDWDSDNWKNGYAKLFQGIKPSHINDFGAISLLDMVVAVDDPRHLVEILSDIQECFKYPADFLAELSIILHEREYFEEAITILQELTVLESYNAEHWLKLADIYANKLDDLEEALNSLDYALAIEPDSPSAQLLLGDLYLRAGNNRDKALEIAERWISNSQFRGEALYLKAGAYIDAEENEKALDALEQYLSQKLNALNLFILIFSLSKHGLRQSMSKRFEAEVKQADEIELERWYAQARRMLGASEFEIAISELAAIDCDMPDVVFHAILTHLYVTGNYDECIARYRRRFGTDVEPKSGLIYVLSLMRSGDIETVNEVAQELLPVTVSAYKNGSAEEYMVQLSVVKTVFAILELAKTFNINDVDSVAELNEIDPFKELFD